MTDKTPTEQIVEHIKKLGSTLAPWIIELDDLDLHAQIFLAIYLEASVSLMQKVIINKHKITQEEWARYGLSVQRFINEAWKPPKKEEEK